MYRKQHLHLPHHSQFGPRSTFFLPLPHILEGTKKPNLGVEDPSHAKVYSGEEAFSHSLLGGVRRQLDGEEACVAYLDMILRSTEQQSNRARAGGQRQERHEMPKDEQGSRVWSKILYPY